MIGDRILEAEQEIYQARLLADKHQYAMAVNKAYRAVLAGAKALLVTEGLDPSTDAETFAEFEQRVAARGTVPAHYRNLGLQIGDLGPKETTAAFAASKLDFARSFVEVCRTATDHIGKDLKLKAVGEEVPSEEAPPAQATEPASSAPSAAPIYDLRGVACPLNYVKTKLRLEMMDTGERLEVWLDAGEPIKNVPMSLRNDGHKVLAEEPLDGPAAHWKVLVEKVEG